MTKSQQRRAENEVVFKLRNEESKRLAKQVLDGADRRTYKLNFVCECSDELCTQPVELTLDNYLSARTNDRHFILYPGHEQPDLEMVIAYDGYNLVEKFQTPPPTDGRLNATQ